MKTIDRYVTRNFLFSYLAILAGLLGLAIIIDASLNLDEFMDQAEGHSGLARAVRLVTVMANWYAAYAVLFFQFLAPIVTVLAGVSTVVMMKRRNEFIPLLASGVSVYRVLWPVLFWTLLASGLAMANQEFLLPRLAGRLARHVSDPEGRRPRSLRAAFTDAEGNRISAPQYVASPPTMLAVHVDGAATPEGRVRLFAKRAEWDSAHGLWRLTQGWLERFDPGERPAPREEFGPGHPRDSYPFRTSIGPPEVERAGMGVQLYAAADLMKQIALQPERGSLAVELHGRYVEPLHMVVLLLLGLPLVLMQESKSVIVGLGIALAICLAYLGAQFVSEHLGSSGRVAPVVAVWLPIFIFGPAAILLFDGIRT